MSEQVLPESYGDVDKLHANHVVNALVKVVQSLDQLREIAHQAELTSLGLKDQLLSKLDMKTPSELLADTHKRGAKDKKGLLTDDFWDAALNSLGDSMRAQDDYQRLFERDALLKLLGAHTDSVLDTFDADWQKQPDNKALIGKRVDIWNPYDVPMVEDHARHKPHLTIPSIKNDETHSRRQLSCGLVISGNVAALSSQARGSIALKNIQLTEYEPINGRPSQKLTIDEVTQRAVHWIFGNFTEIPQTSKPEGVRVVEGRSDRSAKVLGLIEVSDPNIPVFNRKYFPAAAIRVIGSE